MTEALAALIIACSNLAQPTSYTKNQIPLVIELKKKCIERTTSCMRDNYVSYKPVNKPFIKCSKEIY